MSSGKTIGFRFKPSPLGLIPEDWDVVKLGEVGALKDGDWILNKDYADSGVRLIQVGDIGVGTFLNKSKRFISVERAKELKVTFVKPGKQLLISRMPDPIGRACIAPHLGIPYIVAVDITMLEPSQCLDLQFLLYVMNFPKILRSIEQLSTGATRKRVSRSNLERVLIPLPPLPEQKRIAEVLRTVDEAILKVEQEIEHTERLKQGLMQHLLSRGIGHTRFKDSPIGKIPEEWDVVRVKDIGTVITGKTPSTKNDEFWNGDIMFVTPTDYKGKKYIEATERYVTKKGASQSTLIPPKSVLVVCIGSIGEIAINTKSCVTNQQINSIIPSEKIDSEFLYYTLKFKAKILKLWAGTTTTPIIKKSLFEKFTIPLPPLPEQKKIAEILMTVDRKLELLRQKKVHLERIKKGLMNDLLTGKKRLKVNLEGDI